MLGAIAALAVWALVILAAPGRCPALLVALLVATALVALEGRSRPRRGWLLDGAENRRSHLGLVLVAALAFLVALPTREAFFLGDDFGYVSLFHDRPWRDLLRLREISRGIWGEPLDEFRPLFALAYRIGVAVHGVDAVSWHLGNMALHALAAVLVAALARAVGLASSVATLAGLFFAVAPAHAEAVAWVTGRVDVLPTLLYLAAFALFRVFRRTASARVYGLALAAFAAGVFVKEILLTLPLMLVASDLLLDREAAIPAGQPRAWRCFLAVHLPFALLTLLFLYLRFLAVGSFAREERLASTLGHALSGTDVRLRWLLLPFSSLVRSGLLEGLALFGTGLLLGSLLALALLLLRGGEAFRRARGLFLFFGVLWPAVTFLPLLLTYPSPRHLYLPLAGTALALAAALLPPAAEVHVTRTRLVWAFVLLGLHAALLVQHEARFAGAGRISRALLEDLSDRLSELPPGEVVVLSNLPSSARDRRTELWSYALPFALQPPHRPHDLYSRYRILESPDVYCCAPGVWWARKRELVLALGSGPAEEPMSLALLHWNPQRRELTMKRGTLTRGALSQRVGSALGGAPEAVEGVTRARAERLLRGLADAIRDAGDPRR